MSATLPAPSRDQLELLFDSTLPPGQKMFSAKEIAALINVDVKSVGNAFFRENPAKRLLGFAFNFNGTDQRLIKRVPRSFLIMWLIKHARFDLPIFQANVLDLCAGLSTRFLRLFVEIAQAELAKRRD